MNINHIAIFTENPLLLSEFYETVIGLKKIQVNLYADKTIRSVWLQLGESGILMLEETKQKQASDSHLIAFATTSKDMPVLKKRLATHNVPLVKESDYSIYFNDTDGNRLAFSHYPQMPK